MQTYYSIPEPVCHLFFGNFPQELNLAGLDSMVGLLHCDLGGGMILLQRRL